MAREQRSDDESAPLPLTDARVREALPKQRRFLILISLTVIAYYLFTVGIREEANYSGFGLTLAHPERVVWGLWFVWAWALLRYLQVGYALLTDIRDDLDMDVDAEDLRLATKAAIEHARQLAASGKLDEKGRTNVQVSPFIEIKESPDTRRIKRRGGQAIEYPSAYTVHSDGGRTYERIEGYYHWPNDDGHLGTSSFNTDMRWPPEQVRKHRRRAKLHAALRLQAVTEHVAPLVLAALALMSPLMAAAWPKDAPNVPTCECAGGQSLGDLR